MATTSSTLTTILVDTMAVLTACTVAACGCRERGTTETADSAEVLRIETLSDKDIYFWPDTVVTGCAVVTDLVDMANGYAILRAAYCDAELWFRFGGVVNEPIGRINTAIIKDDGIRAAARRYVRTLVEVLPQDTATWEETDSVLWVQVWTAYNAYGSQLAARFALDRYGT